MRKSARYQLPSVERTERPVAKPFTAQKHDPGLLDDHYITLRIVRSFKRDKEALAKDRRDTGPMTVLPLIREDLRPFMNSSNIWYGPIYFTEDRYYVSARYLFPENERDHPEKMLAIFRDRLAQARASGVHGSYKILNLRMGDVVHAGESYVAPMGVVGAGDELEEHSPAEMAGMIHWMDCKDGLQSHVSDGFFSDVFRQFDPTTDAGKALRYGMLLGLQALKDAAVGRAGAPDADSIRAQLLMDLDVELNDEDLPPPR